MSTASILLRLAAAPTVTDRSLKAVALFSCTGLVVSLCLIAFGVDQGLGWE
jgi:hypothetical protein